MQNTSQTGVVFRSVQETGIAQASVVRVIPPQAVAGTKAGDARAQFALLALKAFAVAFSGREFDEESA